MQALRARATRVGELANYRAYKPRGPKGRTVRGKDVESADDGVAMRAADADADCPTCEVWCDGQ